MVSLKVESEDSGLKSRIYCLETGEEVKQTKQKKILMAILTPKIQMILTSIKKLTTNVQHQILVQVK